MCCFWGYFSIHMLVLFHVYMSCCAQIFVILCLVVFNLCMYIFLCVPLGSFCLSLCCFCFLHWLGHFISFFSSFHFQNVDLKNQKAVDDFMLKLDGTPNKGRLNITVFSPYPDLPLRCSNRRNCSVQTTHWPSIQDSFLLKKEKDHPFAFHEMSCFYWNIFYCTVPV